MASLCILTDLYGYAIVGMEIYFSVGECNLLLSNHFQVSQISFSCFMKHCTVGS